MFATVVFVLPSKYTGGAVRVTHGTLSETYDNSAENSLVTSVLAWYTDIEHEVKPITSGYRLALSFNLIHTTNSLRPALSSHSGVASRLRHVLLSWKQADDDGDIPKKIISVLSHKYSQASLRVGASALKGADAHIVALLHNIGGPHGFGIGLANLTYAQTGIGDDSGHRYGPYGKYGGFSARNRDDDRDLNFDTSHYVEAMLSVDHLVDLDGRIIWQHRCSELEDEEVDTEVIPADLVHQLTSGDFDDQEYEGYMGNVS